MLTTEEIVFHLKDIATECKSLLNGEKEALWAAIDLAAENAQLKAELAEYAATFSEQNKALSDNIIANARLKAKLDAVRAECEEDRCRTWTIHRGYQTMVESADILAIIGKDGDTDD